MSTSKSEATQFEGRARWYGRRQLGREVMRATQSDKRQMQLSNGELADLLDECSQRLARQAASPFRVAAYRAAAATVRDWPEPIAKVFQRDHFAGLEKLPGIGKSLARKLGEVLRRGRLRSLENLRRKQAAGGELTSLPMIGPRLAKRIRLSLGGDSFERLYAAAYDGRLRRIAGVGRKREQAIRDCLAARLGRGVRPRQVTVNANEPSVAVLLEIDRIYRERAANGRLVTVAPRRFNPTGAAWLPVMRIARHGHSYRAMFANSARCHQLGRVGDWVVIYRGAKADLGVWTVVTGRYGKLAGRRIVRGRESESRQHYQHLPPKQLNWLADSESG